METREETTRSTPVAADWTTVARMIEVVQLHGGPWCARRTDQPDLYGWGASFVEAIDDLRDMQGWTPQRQLAQV